MALPYFNHKGLVLDVFGLPQFIQGIERAKILSLRFGRGEMKRGLQRVRKSFINTQLKGPPGIKAGTLAQGGNVSTVVGGEDLASLHGQIGISRILHVHEIGMTIRPKTSDKLYIKTRSSGTRQLFTKGSKESSTITAVVAQVRIPARLKFRQHVRHEAPAMLVKVGKEIARGTEIAMKESLNKVVAKL